MKNCFVTQLKEIVQNDNLKKMGEIRVKAINDGNLYIGASGGDVIIYLMSGTATIGGNVIPSDGYIVTSSSNVTVAVTTGAVISVINKYALSTLNSTVVELAEGFSLEDLYLSHLTALGLVGNTSGSIDGLDVSAMTTLILDDCANVSGSVDIFAESNVLTTIRIRSTQIGGNLSSLIGKNLVSSCHFTDSNLRVNVEDCARMSTGNTALTKYQNCYLYGDMSKVSADIHTIPSLSHAAKALSFTWTTQRHSNPSAYILSNPWNKGIPYPNYGTYLDAMLIDQAQCQAYSGNSTICVWGTHTANSGWEDAVTTLKTKGYRVLINDVEL